MTTAPRLHTAIVCAGCAALEARVAALEKRIAPGPRDQHDVDLLSAVAAAAGSLPFTVAAMWRRSSVDPRLADALLACDIDNARQLGKLLRRLTEQTTDAGLRLRRIGTNRDGAVFLVVRDRE